MNEPNVEITVRVQQTFAGWWEWLKAFVNAPAPDVVLRRGRYPNFDLLRLFLAVEVAAVHVWATVDPGFQWNAFVMAVPAFLAVSGFLVLQSYSESGSWKAFIRKRALRILPALLLSFVLCWVLFDWAATWNSILNWATGGLFTLQGWANGPLWSLGWEELAYLLLALLWMFGAYRRPFWIWLLLLLSIGFVWSAAKLDGHTRIIFFLWPAFFIGNLMYLYRGRLLTVSPIVPWIVFYVMLQWRFVPDAALFGAAALLVVQAFSVVFVGMAGAKLIPFRFPDLSYGIYIFHYPIVQYLYWKQGITSLPELSLWTAVLVIVFSLLSWYLVEKPALRFKTARQTNNGTSIF